MMKNVLMMGLLLLQLGCRGNHPVAPESSVMLQPHQLCTDFSGTAIVTFEDPNLEQAIRARFGIGPQDDLTCGLVSGFEAGTFAGYRITSLVGIQNLTSLTSLNLRGNSITDIGALSGLTSLTHLELTNNWISDLSALSGLTSLTRLTLYNNTITEISALSGLTSLTGLNLWRNLITDIGTLSGLTSLTVLSLDYNADLRDIHPLLDNTGLGEGDQVSLWYTNVSCTDVAALEAKGVLVGSACP